MASLPLPPLWPQSQVLIVESKELEGAPVPTLARVWDFLGVPRLDYGNATAKEIEAKLAHMCVQKRREPEGAVCATVTVPPRRAPTVSLGLCMRCKVCGAAWRRVCCVCVCDHRPAS